MIAFSCAQCGMKFQVKDEFAGRKTSCSTCKSPITVPEPVAVVEATAQFNVGAYGGSINEAIGGGGVTLEARVKQIGDETIDPCSIKSVLDHKAKQGERYVVEGEIARGGMGIVLRAIDSDIRREVALKFLIDQSSPVRTLRFIEEAQITGQLEHPNIVPVHELGMDAQKRVFFSMKMIRGRSLAQILDALRNKDHEAEKKYTLGKLLNVLVGVCNALAYAHSLGVVHRDIKPANIMIGDFGEVYVMDWGLAKIVQGEPDSVDGASAPVIRLPGAEDPTVEGNTAGSSLTGGSNKIVTSRQAESELTAEGTIMGTPAYMPPEQARGQVRAIGPRSDVYSVGALLYEVLTLEPPIDREGGFAAMLMRVAKGDIAAPEKRSPARAKAGLIPRELAAVAMKALALLPKKRYATIEALRRDIELFQEGRSVSAKDDTTGELVIKFVKRNKALTAVTSAAALLIATILLITTVISAWMARSAQRAYADAVAAQKEKAERTKHAVPALLDASRLSLDRRRYDNAMTQVKLALDYAPDHVDALLLYAQLQVAVEKDYKEAVKTFDRVLKHRPKDETTRMLRDLCKRERPNEPDNLLVFAELFNRQQMPTLAERMVKEYGASTPIARDFLLTMYRKKITGSWPGLEAKLTVDTSGIYSLDFNNCKEVAVLTPLTSMPLTRLSLQNCNGVRDLAPLRDMPLHRLNLNGVSASDFSPLEGLPLTSLDLSNTRITDLSPLRGMLLQDLSLYGCSGVTDITPLTGMPITKLHLRATAVRDLGPLRKMPLTFLSLFGCTQLTDLGPLEGLKLASLDLTNTRVQDLSPLRGMPLTSLDLNGCAQLRDLSPIRDIELTQLDLANCKDLRDLSPLSKMKLTTLSLANCGYIQDLSPLKEMSLTSLTLDNCAQVRDLTPVAKMPLATLSLTGCKGVTDVTPLQDLKLTSIRLPTQKVEGLDVLRKMSTLKTINGQPADQYWMKLDTP